MYEELVKALKTIKSVCNARCNDCPLSDERGDCLVQANYPLNWKITKAKEVVRIKVME